MFLDICRDYTAALGENRRWLLTALVALIDKTKSATLCKHLDTAKIWVLDKQAAYPNLKEKASLMQKLVKLESRGEVLFTPYPYLEVIYDIYTDPSFRRGELTSRLEHTFLVRCHAKDRSLRERFVDLLEVSVSRSLFNPITYILAVPNWVYLALHLLLVINRPDTRDIILPLQRLPLLDPQTAHDVWVSVFPAVWVSLSIREQSDVTNHMINLLSKEYHIKQASVRPNVIQTLLAGIHACSLPPHLVKYLAKPFVCWHISLQTLDTTLDSMKDDEPTV
ncbi:hypothetical protein H1R20_g16262, partial [Candolleomyces eurysporus]